MSEQPIQNMNDQQAIDDILKEMPSNDAVELNLPSKNRFYTLKEPGKPITLRPMTFADEKNMLSKKDGGVDVINKLLARCMENIDVGQLLQMDKLYILMKLREISYGPEYQVTINCSKCKAENHVNFELNTFPINYVDDNISDPLTVHLPVIKKDVVVKLPRVSDERYFSNPEQSLSNLWRFVQKVDKYDAKSIISKVIPQLPLKDAHVLLDAIGCARYGIDTQVKFQCNYCDNLEDMELPITSDFFSSK